MLNKIRKLREKKGFTLVELIVVIAIIAILTAVIVPLVGRYSAQATYTTLQSGAQTISDNVNNVISDVTAMGTTYNKRVITGKKEKGTFTVTVYPTATEASGTVTGSGTAVTDTTGYEAAETKPTTDDAIVAAKVWDMLSDTMSNNSSFFIWVGNSSVRGVEYSTTASLDLAKASSVTASPNNDFNSAYETGDPKIAIGVSGFFIPAAPAPAPAPAEPTTP